MAVVDPRLNRIPQELLKARDTRLYFEDLERFLHDLWVRTGGGNDIVEDNQYLSFNAVQADLSNVKNELDNIKRTSNSQIMASLSARIDQLESSLHASRKIGQLMKRIEDLEAQQ